MQLNQHTHIPYATTNQTKLGNWKQNKNDNATQKPGKHATNGITKTSKTPNWAKTRRTKPNRMAMETTLCNNDSLPATWTSMPSTFTTTTMEPIGPHYCHRCFSYVIIPSKPLYCAIAFFLHNIPAYILDLIAMATGQKRM